MTDLLWCMHIPGPDEIFAMHDHATATRYADEHNAWLDRLLLTRPPSGDWPERASVAAVVIEWPHDAWSHARDLLGNVFAGKP